MLNENLYELIQVKENHCGSMALMHAQCFPHDVWSEQVFESFYDEILGDMIGWLAIYEDEPIGFILARQVIDTAEILSFGVLPGFQGKGIGKQLLIQLIENVEVPIFLEVSVENVPAICLYRSNGFEIMTTRRNYYDKPNHKGSKDAYLMRYTRYVE
jgi:ribosomal-protein-alanine N-acetyltransferase